MGCEVFHGVQGGLLKKPLEFGGLLELCFFLNLWGKACFFLGGEGMLCFFVVFKIPWP